MENTENKNKIKMKIYEDQTQIQQFVEPEWMRILKKLIENQTMAKNHSIMVKNG